MLHDTGATVSVSESSDAPSAYLKKKTITRQAYKDNQTEILRETVQITIFVVGRQSGGLTRRRGRRA